MMDIYQRNRRVLNNLYNNLGLEDFSELISMMEKDYRLVISGMVSNAKLEKNFDLVKKINSLEDISSCKIIDFLNYNYSLGKDPLLSLIDMMDIMTKPIVPKMSL